MAPSTRSLTSRAVQKCARCDTEYTMPHFHNHTTTKAKGKKDSKAPHKNCVTCRFKTTIGGRIQKSARENKNNVTKQELEALLATLNKEVDVVVADINADHGKNSFQPAEIDQIKKSIAVEATAHKKACQVDKAVVDASNDPATADPINQDTDADANAHDGARPNGADVAGMDNIIDASASSIRCDTCKQDHPMSHHVRPNRLRVSGSSFQQIGKGKDAMTIRSTCITCRYTTSAEINIDNLVEIFGQAVNKHDYYSMLATLDKKLDDEITDIAKNNPDELIDEDDVEAIKKIVADFAAASDKVLLGLLDAPEDTNATKPVTQDAGADKTDSAADTSKHTSNKQPDADEFTGANDATVALVKDTIGALVNMCRFKDKSEGFNDQLTIAKGALDELVRTNDE